MSESAAPRAGGRRFFLWWMLAFLGFPIGGFWRLCWWVQERVVSVRQAEPWWAW